MSCTAGIDAFVRQNVGENISDFRRTLPVALWGQSALFAHAHTQKSVNDAVRAAIGKLGQDASPAAEAFVGCQTVMAHSRNMDRQEKRTPQGKNLHYIVTSCPNDEISLLG
jgi:hypothetical protein